MSSEPPPEATKPKIFLRHAFGGALIFLLVFAAYWPALRGEFVWDDLLIVAKNPLVTGQASLRSIWLHEDFPLTTVALWAEWSGWGKNPAGYHVVNVLLHAISCLLLWRVLARLKIPGAWLAAAIFAVHPVGVASVAWISELKNTLSLPFYLLSLGWYLKFEKARKSAPGSPGIPAGESLPLEHCSSRREEAHSISNEGSQSLLMSAATESKFGTSPAKANLYYWLALGAFLLALLSKTSTVMLPVVLLGCAGWQRGRVSRRDIVRVAPFFALALAFGGMTVWFQSHQAITGLTVQTENFWGRLAGAGWAFWFYLGKALLPLNLNLIYPRWEINAAVPAAWLPLIFLAAVFFLCWKFRHGWGRHALFALGFFVVNLFPALGFFDMYFLAISRVSDHFQYVSLIAVAAVAGAGLSTALPLRALRWVAPALLLTLALLTAQRARSFATDESLWVDVLQKNPNAWPAHNNLGCIRAEQNKIPEAAEHFEKSLKVFPSNAQAHANLARALALLGRWPEAEEHFQAALKLKPSSADIHKAYGAALAEHGNPQAALKELRAAAQAQPDVETLLQLAAGLRGTGAHRDAVAEYRRALALNPNQTEALNNLAGLLATSADATLRSGPEAVQYAETACRLTDFKDAMMMSTLAAAYAEAGRFADAEAMAQRTIALAESTGNAPLANANRQLLRLYRTGRPYHESERRN